MRNVHRHFSYLYRERRLYRFIFFILILSSMIGFSFLLSQGEGKWVSIDGGYAYETDFTDSFLFTVSIVLFILCFIEPAIIFSFKMKRTAFEKEKTHPISKNNLYFVRFIMGYFEIVLPFTFAYFLSIIILFGFTAIFSSFFIIYLVFHILGSLIYSFFTFFYLRANNIIDGFVLMALGFVSVMLLGNAVVYLFSLMGGNKISVFLYDFNPYYLLQLVAMFASEGSSIFHASTIIVMLILLAILGAAFAGVILLRDDFRVENANQKTTSWFGYKTLIPLTLIPAIVFKNAVGLPIYYFYGVLVFALTYLAYALAYRKFIFTKKGWQILAAVLGGEIVLYFITLFV